MTELWDFSTAAFAEEDREAGWRQALASVGITALDIPAHPHFFGITAVRRTPHESEYVFVSSRAQSFSIARPAPSEALLLLVMEGKGEVQASGDAAPLSVISGDFVFGAPRQAISAAFEDDLRLLLLRLPRNLLTPRLLAPLPEQPQLLSGDLSFSALFADLMGSLTTKFATMNADQFRAVETMIAEFLATSVARDGNAAMLGGVTGRRAGLLQRISRSIERRLPESELSLAQVAAENGMSVRNLQKLFETFDRTFSTYVRSRRLERAREDLASPLLGQLSISEICYRWGFTDPAYFSRAFREEFGVSPREFRRVPHLHMADEREGRDLRRGVPRGSTGDAPPEGQPADSDVDRPVPPQAENTSDRGPRDHILPANAANVHWGYLSRLLVPAITVRSGDRITIECLTHHAYDDHERMIAHDPGVEDVFHWTPDRKNVDRRGAGPMNASIYGRGAGEGFGVHICTGPVAVEGARPGDVLEVRILSVDPRPSRHPDHAGRTFGSNAAAFWGFHYKHMLTEPREREVITVYEVDCQHTQPVARAVYSYRWTPQTDPFGVVHPRIDYPGIPVDHSTIVKNFEVLKDIEVPVKPHFGLLAVAPDHATMVDSVPPSSFGGNIDNWRVGAGSTVYLPVAVPGALLSVGDPHASQGDGEACGTAIECSMTGQFELILHKRADLPGRAFADINYPLIETADEWVISGFSHPDYLEELGLRAQSDVYRKSSIDFAMRDAFRKVRRFLMSVYDLTEDEAVSLISVGVDFGVTQVADGNWGVHAVVRKQMFEKRQKPGIKVES